MGMKSQLRASERQTQLLTVSTSKATRNDFRIRLHALAKKFDVRVRSECISPTRMYVYGEAAGMVINRLASEK